MVKKVSMFVLVVVLAGLALVPVVSAQTDTPEAADGFLSAQGDGVAVMAGRGSVELTGNGILWVKDVGGNAAIDVSGFGNKKEFDDGWVQYSGFNGTALIEGDRIVVAVAGADISLEAVGRGGARLWGHGSYSTPSSQGDWLPRRGGAPVRLAPGDTVQPELPAGLAI